MKTEEMKKVNVYKAIETLADYCIEQEECGECPFYIKKDSRCYFNTKLPQWWTSNIEIDFAVKEDTLI